MLISCDEKLLIGICACSQELFSQRSQSSPSSTSGIAIGWIGLTIAFVSLVINL